MTDNEVLNLDWMGEKMERTINNNWLYKLLCIALFRWRRKLTYNEFFLVLYGLNRDKHGEYWTKKWAFEVIVNLYKYNNNKLPEGIESYGKYN